MILAIVVGAAIELNKVYFYPEFKALPPDYDFSQRNITTLGLEASTIAVGVIISDTNKNYS